MIIDLHRHYWSAYERYPELSPAQRPTGELDPNLVIETAIAEMDDAQVAMSVLVTADFELKLGPTKLGITEENRIVRAAHVQHPDRFTPFFGIDPRRPGAADAFAAALRDGFRGIKLHPASGFSPSERVCYPIYEQCVAAGVPVLFHVGPSFHASLYSRVAHPLEFDQVAVDFPELSMVMGHSGADWWRDCLAIARAHPNMILELSEWQLKLRDDFSGSAGAIAEMISAVGEDRIVWGSDFPWVRDEMSLAASIAVFRRLETPTHGPRVSPRTLDKILGDTAARLLHIGNG